LRESYYSSRERNIGIAIELILAFQLRRSFPTKPRVASASERTLGNNIHLGANLEEVLQDAAMPQSLVQIYVHLVFSTKSRQLFLTDAVTRDRLHAYLAGICKGAEAPALIVGGATDHVHILCRLAKTLSVADLVRDLKRDSSSWVKTEFPQLGDFYWQLGYGAFSVSPSHVDALMTYIANQMEHHRTETFQDEFRRLCRKYGVKLDERYVWD